MISKIQLKIIDKYLFKQIFNLFLIGIFLISAVMMSGYLFQLADLIIRQEIPFMEVLELLFYFFPEIIVQTFPMAVLFATLYGLSRLNRNNEFIALRMGGVSFVRIIIPLIILGILISGLTFFINEEVVPWANHRARNIIRLSVLQRRMPTIEEDIFFQGPEGRLFYIKEFDEQTNTLENIVIFEMTRGSKYPQIITANTGEVKGTEWHLSEGLTHKYEDDGKKSYEVDFDFLTIEVEREISELHGRQRTPDEMSRDELREEIELFQRSGLSVNSLLVDYHLKLAIPFIPLIFIMIGTPLAFSNTESKAASIIFTIVIVFSYYAVLSIFRSLGRNGRIEPLIAAWIPNLIFTILSIFLILWRQRWQNIFRKILSIVKYFSFFVFVLLLLFNVSVLAEQTEENERVDDVYNFSGNTLQYRDNAVEIEGNITGSYQKFNFYADKVIIRQDDGEIDEEPGGIFLKTNKVTGCDPEDDHSPHYFFKFGSLDIYPDKFLIGRNVSFWEFNGRLPLFYWPYLYIPLDEKQRGLIPEIGFDQQRGWFIRTTYNYLLGDQTPGSLFFDYYTASGLAGGIKHYLFHEPDEKLFLYFYAQQDKTRILDLFNYQFNVNYERESDNWDLLTDFNFTDYDYYNLWQGDFEFNRDLEDESMRFWSDFEQQDEKTGEQKRQYDLYFNYNRDWENQNVNFNSDFYRFEENGEIKESESELDFLYNREWEQQSFSFDTEYSQTDELTDKKETAYDIQLDFSRTFVSDWELQLNYLKEYLLSPPQRSATKWESESFLKKESDNYDLQLSVKRETPDLEDILEGEEEVSYYHWPEIDFKYYFPYNIDYNIQIGRYLEAEDGFFVQGFRSFNQVDYNYRRELREDMSFNSSHTVKRGDYLVNNYSDEYLLMAYENENSLNTYLTENLEWINSFTYSDYLGESPFSFDEGEEQLEVGTEFDYSLNRFDLNVKSGYSLRKKQFLPVEKESKYQLTSEIDLGMETAYDIERKTFDDLLLSGNYIGQNLNINTEWKYDLEAYEYSDLTVAADYRHSYYNLGTEIEYDLKHQYLQTLIFDANAEYREEPWNFTANFIYEFEEQSLDKWDLELNTAYDKKPWKFYTGLKYDFKNGIMKDWENELIYDLKEEWYLEIGSNYNYEDEEFERADFKIMKNFHCRQLWFSYDHLDGRYMVEYTLNLFPDHSVDMESGGDKGFSFDLGLRELFE